MRAGGATHRYDDRVSEPSAEFEEESRPAADSPPRAEAIRAAAELQWSQDPAGAIAVGSDSIDTPASFAQIEHYRYGEQPWMHETFQFERFAGRQVLEIGVGLGTDHLQFARAGAQMTGIDLTARCVELTPLSVRPRRTLLASGDHGRGAFAVSRQLI